MGPFPFKHESDGDDIVLEKLRHGYEDIVGGGKRGIAFWASETTFLCRK